MKTTYKLIEVNGTHFAVSDERNIGDYVYNLISKEIYKLIELPAKYENKIHYQSSPVLDGVPVFDFKAEYSEQDMVEFAEWKFKNEYFYYTNLKLWVIKKKGKITETTLTTKQLLQQFLSTRSYVLEVKLDEFVSFTSFVNAQREKFYPTTHEVNGVTHLSNYKILRDEN